MGFSEKNVEQALRNCYGDVERAADWLISHPHVAEGLVEVGAGTAKLAEG